MNASIATHSDRQHYAVATVETPEGPISREFSVEHPCHEYRYGNQAYALAYDWIVEMRKARKA